MKARVKVEVMPVLDIEPRTVQVPGDLAVTRPNGGLPDLGADEFLWATQRLHLPAVLR